MTINKTIEETSKNNKNPFVELPNNQKIIEVNNKDYIADKVIEVSLENKEFEIENCVGIFFSFDYKKTIENGMFFREYLKAEKFKVLNKSMTTSSINGYDPKYVFCYIDTEFPLEEFRKKWDL